MLSVRLALGLFLLEALALCWPGLAAENPAPVFNVRDYGAVGDGVTLDTAAFNRAVSAGAEAGGGQVLVPPGRYLSGTIRLRSHLTLFLAPGATIVGTTNLALYQTPAAPSHDPEIRYRNWHRGLIVSDNAEDITICGQGSIDGNKVFDPRGEERMRGPHTIIFAGCRGFNIRDITIRDSANYAILFLVSDSVEVRNVTCTGGWDGVHFRGATNRPCRKVNILNCHFQTGDDSIAGSYWEDTVISGCIINSSCNGLRLIGPANRLIVSDCLFYGPGMEPHRSSNRYNMLSGIILQPGAWGKTEGLLDNVLLANNTMRDVAAPVTLWTKPGSQAGRITISGLNATGVYRSALSAESWSDSPITNVVLRNAHIEFAGQAGTPPQQPVQAPGVDARPLPPWGIYARNLQRLTVEDVRLSLTQDDLRPVILADTVASLNLDQFKFTRVTGAAPPLLATNVARVNLRETDIR